MIDQYTLIAKELAGITTAEETALLKKWRSESEANEETYQGLKESWHLIHASSNWVIPNKEKTWNDIVNQISRTISKPVKMYTKSMLLKTTSIAALIAIIITMGIAYIYQSKRVSPAEIVQINAPRGQKSEIILPDGSKVWLNSGSTLTYHTDYNKDNRTVELQGEAFFEVSPNRLLTFDVLLENKLKVQVHGTKFNVNAYHDDPNASVSLLEGSVSVMIDRSYDQRDAVSLEPNQKIVVNKTSYQYQLETCDAEIESLWRLGRLKIEQATLTQVIKKMERWYGVDIQMEGKDTGKLYWLTIKTESLNEMLELINRITPIKYTVEGEEVMIRYK
ncbi:FecR family protein [Parabacteroides sp. Marseille-P3160]|uniref:FecR family protein n=1 Tax=Parabacteroides sp. Marseille-P3160 TaxID=1917887 RepID=UPI0011198492|nr:FecR family protein [Parabacteroides sp. Marseille-P3160]